LSQGHVGERVSAYDDDAVPSIRGDEIDGSAAKARREQAVDGARATAALKVAKDDDAYLGFDVGGEGVGEALAGAAEPDDATAGTLCGGGGHGDVSAFGNRTFGDDHDRERASALASPPDLLDDRFDPVRDLGKRMTSAPPARPLSSARKPAFRPITSTTTTRS
jgi:hypothetical protein